MSKAPIHSREKKLALRQLAEQYPWLSTYVTTFGSPSSAGGRPPTAFPRKGYHCSLSTAELSIITKWQKRLQDLLDRKPARGETVGLLTHIFTNTYQEAQAASAVKPGSLDDLLKIFVNQVLDKKQQLRELAKTYPYLGMVAASLDTRSFSTGRYPATAARKSYSLRLTRVEASLLDDWQERVRQLTNEKSQRGEVVGLITGIVSMQFEEIAKTQEKEAESLEELLKMLKNIR